MTTILVTGGTGKLGRPLVARLREGGQDVRVLSRRDPHHPVDLRKGQGLDAALAGVGTVVHCASSPTGGDAEAAGNLLAAAGRAGVEHLVYISIVGVDQIPYPYYRVKHQVERMVEESGIGWTVLRATQFHDLVRSVLRALGRPPVMVLPKGLKDQPVAVEEVAGRLAELALGGLRGGWPTWAGPRCGIWSRWRMPGRRPPGGGGRGSGCRWRGGPTGRSGRGGIWLLTGTRGPSPSRSSWRSGGPESWALRPGWGRLRRAGCPWVGGGRR